MAKRYFNDKGFYVIEMSGKEAVRGLKNSTVVCDSCLDHLKDVERCYYVAVLNYMLCEDCLKAFLHNAVNWEEDRFVERKNYEFYSKVFGLEEDD